MKPSFKQKTITNVIKLVPILVIVGGLLNTFYITIALITPPITYYGSVFTILLFAVACFYLQRWGLEWITDDSQKVNVRKLGLIPWLYFVAVLIVLWLPRTWQPKDSTKELLAQMSEIIDLQATTAAKQLAFQQWLATLDASGESSQPNAALTRTVISAQLGILEATNMALQLIELTVTAAIADNSSPEASKIPVHMDAPTESAEQLTTKSTMCGEIIAVQDLNIRRGPGLNFEIVGTLPGDNGAVVLGQYGFSQGKLYWYIACPTNLDAESCWVSGGEEHTVGVNISNCPLVTPVITPDP